MIFVKKYLFIDMGVIYRYIKVKIRLPKLLQISGYTLYQFR